MLRRWLIVLLTLSVIGSSVFVFSSGVNQASANAASTVSVPASPIPESEDFATVNFGKAWDMSEFTDISQYLNGAGRHPSLANIQVKDGVFSAQSIGDRNGNLAYFYPLFGGHQGFMQIGGNLGSLKPVDPQTYQCFYIAMKVNSPQYKLGVDLWDGFRVLWSAAGKAGGTNQISLYPETLQKQSPVVHSWRLYRVDLNAPPNGIFDGAWTSNSIWQALQINPTLYKDIPFAIDWMRLTSCKTDPKYLARITWGASGSVNAIWANPVGTDRNIQLATGVDGSKGAYDLDTKGLAPGAYRIGLGTTTSCCSEWSSGELKINQAPVINFVRPSPYSGEDYATSAGNPWDMDPSDFTRIDCTQYSFGDGLLRMDTAYPAALPRECKGSTIGEADPQLFLNLPASLDVAGQYRYLSFRKYMNGDYAMPADGMIGRWMWTTTNDCTRVSADIPYEVGWHTYTIDLYDAFNGTPVASSPPSCGIKHWKATGQVTRLRFDPNENWTGNQVPQMTFHQELDWIRLTKVDQVARGATFPIEITANKPLESIRSISYYFTTDRKNPTQNPAGGQETFVEAGSDTIAAAQQPLYLPLVRRNSSGGAPGAFTFNWNTASVAPGEYYICSVANDGYNQTTYCSDAPIRVYSP